MSDKVINVVLSPEGIDAAIQQLDAYKNSLREKTRRLAQLIAERVAWSAVTGFHSAVADDIFVGGSPKFCDVSVDIQDNGNLQIVIASGEDAVFVEFGAGVYYNGAAGASPHPKGAEMGYLIGGYGKGYGKRSSWHLPESTHQMPVLSHGTPAAMPMYHGAEEARRVMEELAREVFST